MDAAGLLQQMNVGDENVLLHGLAHVVDRERGGADGRQCFHLNARVPGAGGRRGYLYGKARFIQRERNVYPVYKNWVAHRDDVRRVLCGHYARDLRPFSCRRF